MWYRDVFGPGRWYIEFQEHGIPELTEVNKYLWELAQKYDIPVVVTNDVHYTGGRCQGARYIALCTDQHRTDRPEAHALRREFVLLEESAADAADLPALR